MNAFRQASNYVDTGERKDYGLILGTELFYQAYRRSRLDLLRYIKFQGYFLPKFSTLNYNVSTKNEFFPRGGAWGLDVNTMNYSIPIMS